jgi:8-oxo-dGTP pyrophosphatase MutT (NUDIX family)
VPEPVGKTLAYVTRICAGRLQLLVFTQPAWQDGQSDAGLQVPGGTMDPGETPEQAVERELFEEAGLRGLRLVGKLGELFQAEWNHVRHVFHFEVDEALPDAWDHIVTGEGLDKGWTFRYCFMDIADLPELAGQQGSWLHLLDK